MHDKSSTVIGDVTERNMLNILSKT